MNGTAITNRLPNSFKIKDNNVYGSSYYWNFRISSFKQVACLILVFNGVICDVSTYTFTVSFCRSTWIRYQQCVIGSWPNNTYRLMHFPFHIWTVIITRDQDRYRPEGFSSRVDIGRGMRIVLIWKRHALIYLLHISTLN
jgi:hypothetical protein